MEFYMNKKLIGPIPVSPLHRYSQPSISLICFGKIERFHRIGKSKKLLRILFIKYLNQFIIFIINHFSQSIFGHITGGSSVVIKMVAERLIVGRNRFGNGIGSSSRLKQVTCRFLTAANFGHRAIILRM